MDALSGTFDIHFTVKSLYDAQYLDTPTISPSFFKIDVPDSVTVSQDNQVMAERFTTNWQWTTNDKQPPLPSYPPDFEQWVDSYTL